MHVQKSCTELHDHTGVPAVLSEFFSGRDEPQADGEGGFVLPLIVLGADAATGHQARRLNFTSVALRRMLVCRLNFSHGIHTYSKVYVSRSLFCLRG